MANAKKTTKRPGERKRPSARRSSKPKRRKRTPRWLHLLIAVAIMSIALFVAYHTVFKQSFFRFAVCKGIKAYRTCLPKGYSAYGIDVSHHQGEINWEKIRKESDKEVPISFAYIKATEGRDHKDRLFDKNWAAAKKAGLTRGAYHYFTEASTGDAQALMYITNVKLEPGDLPPMVDVEEEPDNKESYIKELKKFILRLEEFYGIKPLIYSYAKFHNRHLDDPFFNNYELWVAHYYTDSPNVKRDWSIWQCTDIGRIPGIAHKVDINVVNGGIEKLNQLLIKPE